MKLDDLRKLAEKVKDSLPLDYTEGESDAYLEYGEEGDEAAVLSGPDAKPLAAYLCGFANAGPALLDFERAVAQADKHDDDYATFTAHVTEAHAELLRALEGEEKPR